MRNMLLSASLLVASFAFFSFNFLVAKSQHIHNFHFQEYSLEFPENWREVSAGDLRHYLGVGRELPLASPWHDPSFARGWSEVDQKSKRQTLCTVYRVKNERELSAHLHAKAIFERYNLKTSGCQDVKLTAQGEEQISGFLAKWFDVEMSVQARKIKVRHYVISAGKTVYYLYFTATPKHFSKTNAQYKQIACSFKIKI